MRDVSLLQNYAKNVLPVEGMALSEVTIVCKHMCVSGIEMRLN